MKEWKCILAGHHDNVGKAIEEWEKMGWRLHPYACTGNASIALGTNITCCLKRASDSNARILTV